MLSKLTQADVDQLRAVADEIGAKTRRPFRIEYDLDHPTYLTVHYERTAIQIVEKHTSLLLSSYEDIDALKVGLREL
jgi:hypothetical protein